MSMYQGIQTLCGSTSYGVSPFYRKSFTQRFVESMWFDVFYAGALSILLSLGISALYILVSLLIGG